MSTTIHTGLCRSLRLLWLLTWFTLPYSLQSQEYNSSLQTTTLQLDSDTLIGCATTIIPESVILISYGQGPTTYEITNEGLRLMAESPDSVAVSYRVLPYDLQSSKPVMDINDIDRKSRVIKIQGDYTQEELDERRYIQSNRLEYTGSFTRGVNFGNTQDLILNSNFNLQMKGDLGNGLQVRAAISDDNIPIQPEGNTQVLQEFDKLFIELSKDSTTLIAGDYELARPNSYFMNYFKKLKGLSVIHDGAVVEGWRSQNRGSFAISRGKFKRLNLVTTEGNQGPYRLQGDNGEVFLQVLSGTEKVFLDGRLLQRGENHDYVIDYNRAELRFTPNILITAFTRIIVEYEYATQSYLRSLYATSSSFQIGNWQFGLNIYNEQDSKTSTSNISLDSIDLAILRESGDTPALRPGTFIPEEGGFDQLIKYRNENGILTYAPDDSIGVVAARFSELGQGNGSYIIDTIAAVNGRVYRYEGPGQGSYEPVVQLIAPEKKQLITASANFSTNENNSILLETSLSNNDKNRIAEIGNNDNIGLGFHLDARTLRSLKRKETEPDSLAENREWKLLLYGSGEMASMNFQALNPYRAPEFFRDWNYTNAKDSLNEILYRTGAKIFNGRTSLEYNLRGFHADGFYDGTGHVVTVEHNDDKWAIRGKLDLLNTKSVLENTEFLRPNLLISREIYNKWRLGVYYEKEQNKIRDRNSNNLTEQSFNYDLSRVYLSSDESRNFYINANVDRRIDHRLEDENALELEQSSESLEYGLGGGIKLREISDLKWKFTIRDYKVTDAFLDDDESKKTVLGLIDHRLTLLNSGLTLNSYAETNSGQEPKIEFQYVKVQKGEGTYRWEDLNGDEIPQVNEFLVEPFSDQAEYEKISIFNNEFISSVKTVLNQSLRINPKKFLKNKNNLASRFQLSSRYRIDQRSVNNDSERIIDRIIFSDPDSTFVFYNGSMDHDLFFNRGNATYDLQFSYRTLNNQITQITGYERRGSREYYGRARVNLFQSLDVLCEYSNADKTYDSEMFPLDYLLDIKKITPQINYRPSTKLRFVAKFKFESGSNRMGPELSSVRDIGLEATWRSGKSNLQVRLNLVNIEFSGTTNAVVKLEMLQGLDDGQNYLWSLNYTKRLGKNFDLILNYNGRQMEDSRMVNNLGAQIRAIF